MDNKEFKQELIQELLLNIQPSYYKADRERISICFILLYNKTIP